MQQGQGIPCEFDSHRFLLPHYIRRCAKKQGASSMTGGVVGLLACVVQLVELLPCKKGVVRSSRTVGPSRDSLHTDPCRGENCVVTRKALFLLSYFTCHNLLT